MNIKGNIKSAAAPAESILSLRTQKWHRVNFRKELPQLHDCESSVRGNKEEAAME